MQLKSADQEPANQRRVANVNRTVTLDQVEWEQRLQRLTNKADMTVEARANGEIRPITDTRRKSLCVCLNCCDDKRK